VSRSPASPSSFGTGAALGTARSRPPADARAAGVFTVDATGTRGSAVLAAVALPAVALGTAARLARLECAAESARLAALRDHLEAQILRRVEDVRVNGSRQHRSPNTSNLLFEGIEGEAVVIALDLRGFAVSSGAACSSGAVEPSHVLTAIGLSKSGARSSVRFSLGASNDEAQVDALVEAVVASVAHLRRLAGKILQHA